MLNDGRPQQQIEQVVGFVPLGLCLAADQSLAGAREQAVNVVLIEDEEIATEDKAPLLGVTIRVAEL